MKIYVRERQTVEKIAETPRFQVVAVAGAGLHLYAGYMRKTELEQIAKDVGADIIYLGPLPENQKKKAVSRGSPSKADLVEE